MTTRKYNFTTGIETSTFPAAADATGDNDIAPFSQLNTLFSTAGGTVNYVSGDDQNFNASVGTWVAYADSDSSTPTDGTGGSPSITMTRTTSDPLRGSGSGLLTKPGSDVRGQGVSVDFTIDSADLGKFITVKFDYSIGGTVVVGSSGDFAVFIYNKDGTALITPSNNHFETASGVFECDFVADDTDNDYRLIIHCASESTEALTMKIDNIQVGPKVSASGSVIGEWVDFTPTGSWTANTTYTGKWRRVGSNMEIQYNVATSGTPTTADLTLNMPSGYSVDAEKLISGDGNRHNAGSGIISESGVAILPCHAVYDEDDGNFGIFVFDNATGNDDRYNTVAQNDPFNFGSGDSVTVTVSVPISGWIVSAPFLSGSIYRMSNILVNGTQITDTSEPSALGEYKIYKKAINSSGGSVDSTAATISTADGIKIISAKYDVAGSNGDANRFEMFIGKNKTFFIEAFASTGRTTPINITPYVNTSDARLEGTFVGYDATTGILYLDTMTQSSSVTTARSVGISIPTDGSAASAPTTGYFDVIVSDPPAQFISESANSFIHVSTGNGHGSTNTAIRRFTTTVDSNGTTITYSDSSTLGGSFTINEPGMYHMYYEDISAVNSALQIGVSLNSTQLTTGINGITAVDRLTSTQGLALSSQEFKMNCSAIARLSVGDVIRAHTSGSNQKDSDAAVFFRIIKIAD